MSEDVAAASTVADPDHTLKQLRWRCRRGMRELDVLLSDYLERCYPTAEPIYQAAFQHLLEQEDDQLWDWLLGRSDPTLPELKLIVAEIGALRGQ